MAHQDMTARAHEERGQRERRGFLPLILLAGLLGAELLVIAFAYKHNFEFVCRDAAPAWLCAGLSDAIVRAIAVAGVAAVVLIARREILALFARAMRPALSPRWIGVQVIGFAALLIPWFFVSDASGSGTIGLALALWLGGGIAAAIGAALALVPLDGWRSLLATLGTGVIAAFVVAFFAPEIAGLFQNVWKYDPVTEFTFASVHNAILALGYEVYSDPPIKELAVGEFGVLVGPQCSGVEGFLLITSFLGFYIWLFREQLRFPHVLSLLVIGIILSWCFNVVRVVALILIGHHWSPDLAINGFHSHAGWLMFTIVAVGLSLAAHSVPWFQKEGGHAVKANVAPEAAAEKPPFFEDPYIVQILPFLLFMLSALLASTFFEVPAVAYPLRFVVMAAGVAIALPYLLQLDWRPDPFALASGAAIGILWIAVSPAPDTESPLAQALAGMSAGMLGLWVITRVLGTVVLVPAIEELFFRGYILRRIDDGGMVKRILAIVISTALFAALHGRFWEAGLAGIVFALVMLRRGRLSDAIICHAAANAMIAAWALIQGDWSVI